MRNQEGIWCVWLKKPPPAKELGHDDNGGGARESQPRGAGSTTDAFWGDQYES